MDLHPPQQVGVDLMLRVRFAGMGTRHCTLQTHQLHEPLDPLVVDRVPLPHYPIGHFAVAKVAGSEILLINNAHVFQVLETLSLWLIVVAGTIQAQQAAL